MALPSEVFDGVIDVSHWQDGIAWSAVAESGIALAFIKATNGIDGVDPTFKKNYAAAKAAGIIPVPYHFITSQPASNQARNFAKVAGLKLGTPAMLDWETSAPVETVTAIGQYIKLVTGRDPICYYGAYKLMEADPLLTAWPLMLPGYPRDGVKGDYASLVTSEPHLPPGRNPARPYDFHQYTQNGRVRGIMGNVDRSIWVGNLDSLRKAFS